MDTNLNAGCALLNLSVDVVHWFHTGQDERGWTQIPAHHLHQSERVLLGSYDALFFSSSHHSEVFLGNHYIEQGMEKIILTFYL